jgi:hypothetical protein
VEQTRDEPIWSCSSISPLLVNGCEQHVLVHMPGKVIFSSARLWSKSLPVSGWNRKTEKARCNGERVSDDPGGGIRWPVSMCADEISAAGPVADRTRGYSQSFFEPSPMALSSLSRRINLSSMRLICSASYFVGSSVIVSDVRGPVWSAYNL